MPRKGARTYGVTVFTCSGCGKRFENLPKATAHQDRCDEHSVIVPTNERRLANPYHVPIRMPESREQRERKARRAQSAAQQEEEENDELLF